MRFGVGQLAFYVTEKIYPGCFHMLVDVIQGETMNLGIGYNL